MTCLLTEYLSCSRHPDRLVTHICFEENIFCCTKCVISDHRQCITVEEIHEHVSKLKEAADIKNPKEKIQDMFSKIKTLTDYKKATIPENKEKAAKLITRVEDIRTKVNNVLDALMENFRSSINAVLKKNAGSVAEDIDKLQELTTFLKGLDVLIDSIQNVNTVSHVFVILHKLKVKLKEVEDNVLQMGRTVTENKFELKLGHIITNLIATDLNDTDKLITVKECLQVVSLPDFPPMVNLRECRIEKFSTLEILHENSPRKDPEYHGITYLASGCLFLTDFYGGSCCLTDKDCKAVASCSMANVSGKPFGVTCIKNGFLAVSIPGHKKICILSEQAKSGIVQCTDTISTRLSPKALFGLKNGSIAVSWTDPVAFGIIALTYTSGLQGYTEEVYFERDKSGRVMKNFDFMAVDERRSHVIQPCTQDKAVYCFNFQGQHKFVYTHSALVSPRGVTCDMAGNVFICDEAKSQIHIISADGTGLRVIKKGCPSRPIAVGLNSNETRFAVTNRDSPWPEVTFFSISA